MPQHDIVVAGGSAGALKALTDIVELVPSSLQACVLVVIHTRSDGDGVLPAILQRRTSLPVAFADDHDPLTPGRVYIARPDYHLLVTPTELRVAHGPRENGFRPAIDPLFRTAARAFGSRVVGVILSGGLSDGAYGLNLIKRRGGVAIVQDPEDAIIDSLPRNVIAAVDVDHVLPAKEIAAAIARLSQEPAGTGGYDMPRSGDLEPQLPSEETSVAGMEERFGAPAPLTCPDCGGTLWEIHEDGLVRYQCHVGHQYAPEVLETTQHDAVDGALWSAVRALEEQAELKGRMARRAASTGLSRVSEAFDESARDAHSHAQQIRSVLFGRNGELKIGRTKDRD